MIHFSDRITEGREGEALVQDHPTRISWGQDFSPSVWLHSNILNPAVALLPQTVIMVMPAKVKYHVLEVYEICFWVLSKILLNIRMNKTWFAMIIES